MGDPGLTAVRFLLYAALGLSFGLLLFPMHALPAGSRDRAVRRARPLLVLLAATGLLASLAGLAVLAGGMLGLPLSQVGLDEIATILALPGLGTSIVVRIAALALLVALLLLAPGRRWMMALSAGVALSSLAWAGHGASGGRLHLAATVLHLLAAGLWLGAIAGYLLMMRYAGRDELAAALGRFAGTGGVIVGLLLVSGAVNALMIAGWPLPAGFLGSPWTMLLALKLALFAGMMGLAALHRFRLVPALAAGERVNSLRFSLATELALGCGVLILVSILGQVSPAA
ncbi:copper homeostasis membrane protein CopD [Sandaracinobacter neustonicus]|uniref:Copper homeostasis membrane protein CopD n=1 Tax=Sandaracinobacter neustonicus TaxID=1715348 RepID=A0A501XPI6_9SPHN|nr:copper homeostasis membrane protein CopD [Sandaracinobacter neustonicus]TPE62612.1 copper homeostasis membrane protein CopD [Sandaracinobacter neustonicus]